MRSYAIFLFEVNKSTRFWLGGYTGMVAQNRREWTYKSSEGKWKTRQLKHFTHFTTNLQSVFTRHGVLIKYVRFYIYRGNVVVVMSPRHPRYLSNFGNSSFLCFKGEVTGIWDVWEVFADSGLAICLSRITYSYMLFRLCTKFDGGSNSWIWHFRHLVGCKTK